MAISVAADESLSTDHPELEKELLPMKANHRASGDFSRRFSGPRREADILDLDNPPRDVTSTAPANIQKSRTSSLNRRETRTVSKERGGTQLPIWAETRTTRLRRNKALNDSKTSNSYVPPRRSERLSNRKKSVSKNLSPNVGPNLDAEDEADEDDNGKILMERIRANSRCLRARLSSHTRRYAPEKDTGSEGADGEENTKYKGNYTGVYTMHTRRQLRVGTHDPTKNQEEDKVEIENTSIQLLDEAGDMVDLTGTVPITNEDLEKELENDLEILHHHTLSVQGEDTRDIEEDSQEVSIERHYVESAEEENLEGNSGVDPPAEVPATEDANTVLTAEVEDSVEVVASKEEQEEYSKTENSVELEDQQSSANENETESAQTVIDANEAPSNETSPDLPVETLEEGQIVNIEGNLTIEVEVKELNGDLNPSADNAIVHADPHHLLEIDSNIEYDSYPVYSEQNLNLPHTSSVEFTVPVSAASKRYTKKRAGESRSRTLSRKQDRPQYSRGIYLRRMEHRDNSLSSMKRTRSDGGALDIVDRLDEPSEAVSTSHTRRGGMGSIEKWNTTSSTGDLRELPWDHVPEKERLLTILDEVRQETRAREKQREELLRRIKQLQNRVHQRQEQGEETQNQNSDHQNRCLRSLPQFARRADSAPVREMWRKRYLEAKKVTPRLEEECSRLRLELDKLHRELLARVQAGVWALLTISGKTEKPSNKLSYKIMIARLLQEIEDLSRRVEGTRLKLHTEMKLRAMAEKDVRNLREELLKKKIQVTLTRNQEQAALGNGIRQQYFISAV